MQKLLSKARQAIKEFNMIEENDKIAVGLSGGKDSLTLLHILKSYQRFSPEKFDLIAIHYFEQLYTQVVLWVFPQIGFVFLHSQQLHLNILLQLRSFLPCLNRRKPFFEETMIRNQSVELTPCCQTNLFLLQ